MRIAIGIIVFIAQVGVLWWAVSHYQRQIGNAAKDYMLRHQPGSFEYEFTTYTPESDKAEYQEVFLQMIALGLTPAEIKAASWQAIQQRIAKGSNSDSQ